VGGLTLPEAGTNFEDREDIIYFNHNGLITKRLMNQFRLLVARQHTLLLAPLAGFTIAFGLYWSPIYDWVVGSLPMWLPQVQAATAQLVR